MSAPTADESDFLRRVPSGRGVLRFGVSLAAAALLVASAAPAAAQDATEASDESETEEPTHPDLDDDNRVDSIKELPKADKKKLLKLIEGSKENFSAGRFREVVSQMEDAYDIYQDPEFLFRIARSHEQLENNKKAARYYEQYLEEKPETKKRGRVESNLARVRDEIRQEEQNEPKESQPQREPTASPEQKPNKGPKTSDATSAESGGNVLPVALTSIGGSLAAASVTFGVLNLQTKATVDDIREDPGASTHSNQTESSFRDKAREQNLFAGLTIGTGVAAASVLTWAFLEWSSESAENRPETGETGDANALADVGLTIGPRSVGIRGSF